VPTSYDEAHKHQLANSRRAFHGWVIDDLIKADPATLDRDALLDENIPRGDGALPRRPHR
jgi:hypothetical protein